MNKKDFMELLGDSLSTYGVSDARDILLDFEQHFEDGIAAGETEEQVCEKLGDPIEIAKQYIPEGEIKVEEKKQTTQASGFDTNDYAKQTVPPVYNAQPQAFKPDAGKIIVILLIDIMIFTWALPTLISLVVSLYGIVVGFAGSGIAVFIGGILMSFMDTTKWFFTTLSPLSTSLFGIVLLAACPLLVIASIAATKGVINVFKYIINWHSETLVGRKVCNINKKGEAAE